MVIGDGTPNFQRFLLTNEPTFDEFLKSHPLSKQIAQGATFRPRILARIAREYRLKLGRKVLWLIPTNAKTLLGFAPQGM